MKKLYFVILLSASALLFLNFNYLDYHMRSSGSPGGNTGAPGQFGGRTCANSSCHSGGTTFQAGMISSDIPATGFVPGQTYTITGTVSESGRSKFGFEISPQDSLGNLLGSIALINNTETKFTNQNKSVTHTSSGNSGPGGMRSWSLSWTAPNDGTDFVTFWGAFAAANSNNNNSGDIIYRSLLQVEVDTNSLVGLAENDKNPVFIYPNPVQDQITVDFRQSKGSPDKIIIHDELGRELKTQRLAKNATKITMDLNDLNGGHYFARITDRKGNVIVSKRILKL